MTPPARPAVSGRALRLVVGLFGLLGAQTYSPTTQAEELSGAGQGAQGVRPFGAHALNIGGEVCHTDSLGGGLVNLGRGV